MLFEGLLKEDPNDGRPLIQLGDAEAVRQVYRGERRVQMREMVKAEARKLRAPRRGRADAQIDVLPERQALFDALRAWRRDQSRLQAVPPYLIFHDRTLAEIAQTRPATLAELASVGGVGQGKLDRYGEAVLELVRGS